LSFANQDITMSILIAAKILAYNGGAAPKAYTNMLAVTLQANVAAGAGTPFAVGDTIEIELDSENGEQIVHSLRPIDPSKSLTKTLVAADLPGPVLFEVKAFIQGGTDDKATFGVTFKPADGTPPTKADSPLQAIGGDAFVPLSSSGGFKNQQTLTLPTDATIPPSSKAKGYHVKFSYVTSDTGTTAVPGDVYYIRFYFTNSTAGKTINTKQTNKNTFANLKIYAAGDFTNVTTPNYVDVKTNESDTNNAFYLLSDDTGQFQLDILGGTSEVYTNLYASTTNESYLIGNVVVLDPRIHDTHVSAPSTSPSLFNYPDVTQFYCDIEKDNMFSNGSCLYVFCGTKMENLITITANTFANGSSARTLIVANDVIAEGHVVGPTRWTAFTSFVYVDTASGSIRHSSECGVDAILNGPPPPPQPIVPDSDSGESIAAPTFPTLKQAGLIQPIDCIHGLRVDADWSKSDRLASIVEGSALVVQVYINGYIAGTDNFTPKSVLTTPYNLTAADVANKAFTVTVPYEQISHYGTSLNGSQASTIQAQFTITDALTPSTPHVSPATASINFVSEGIGGTN
jgi:hypothetical protein